MRKDIIITGATGLVGKRLVTQIGKYHDKKRILCLVRDLNTEFEKKGRSIIEKQKIDYIKVDLTKLSTLKKIPLKPKIVFHLAANTETLENDHSVNDLGTMNLVKALKLTKDTHFLHASTVTFLATRPDCSEPITEDGPTFPTNEYSRTKLRAEKFLISLARKNKFRLTVLNLNTIYGEGVRDNSLFDTIKKMVLKKNLLSKINWPGITSIVDVDDVVKAFLELSETRKIKNQNIEKYLVYSQNFTMAELYKLAYRLYKIKYNEIKLPNFFWKICSYMRRFIPYFEKILPNNLYNWIWRAGLIVDNAAYCESDKLRNRLKIWKPKLLQDNLEIVLKTSAK